MNNLTTPQVSLHHNRPVTTSLNVADVFGKKHKDVSRTIREMDIPQEFDRRNFTPISYTDVNNRKQPAYELTRDGFTLLAMGFTGKAAMQFKIKYIELFNAMESELTAPRDDFSRLDVNNAALMEENNQLKDELLAMHRKYLGQIEKPKAKRRQPTPITDSEINRMHQMHAEGMSNADIARSMKRSSASVSFILRGAAHVQ